MSSEEFKKRFLSFHSLIYRMSYQILGNREDADDIAQEVYIKLWEQRNDLGDIRNDEAFVMTITKNCSIDLLRSRQRTMTTPVEESKPAYHSREEERMEAQETLSNLMQSLHELPHNQQQVIRLRHFADRSISEIAGITGLTEANIRQLLSRARRTMKKRLNDQQ